MRHVNVIRKFVEQGQREEAHSALDDLLALGPKNVEALKLRAFLYSAEGNFAEEAKIWDKILTIDGEDPDAIRYYLKQRHEDQEHFYFTELLHGGARRFHAYPKALLNTAIFGLFGCVSFVVVGRMLQSIQQPQQLWILLALFVLLVVAPFAAIFAVYLRAIRHVTISPAAIEVATRFRRYVYRWQDIEKMTLVRNYGEDDPALELVITPRDPSHSLIAIDMADETSAIRAKSYLLRELAQNPVGVVFEQGLGRGPKIAPPIAKRQLLRF